MIFTPSGGARVVLGVVAMGVTAATTATASATDRDHLPTVPELQPHTPLGPPAPRPASRGASPASPDPDPSSPGHSWIPGRSPSSILPEASPMGAGTDAVDRGDADALASAESTPQTVAGERMSSVFDGCRLPDRSSGESILDPECAFALVRERYRSFRDHHESGQLVEEIDLGDDVVRRTETRVECTVQDGRFEVSTTARRIRTFFGRVVPIRSGPGVEEASREIDRWLVPHAILDRDAPERFGASAATDVRLDDRDLIRLELEGGGDRVQLFVNPETVVVERALGERALPDGGRWRGQLDLEVVGSAEALPALPGAGSDRADRVGGSDAANDARSDTARAVVRPASDHLPGFGG